MGKRGIFGIITIGICLIFPALWFLLFSGIPREYRGEWIFSPERTISLNEKNPLWKSEYTENIRRNKFLRGYKITQYKIGATLDHKGLLTGAKIIKREENCIKASAKQGDKTIIIQLKLGDHNTLHLKVEGEDFSDVYTKSQ